MRFRKFYSKGNKNSSSTSKYRQRKCVSELSVWFAIDKPHKKYAISAKLDVPFEVEIKRERSQHLKLKYADGLNFSP